MALKRSFDQLIKILPIKADCQAPAVVPFKSSYTVSLYHISGLSLACSLSKSVSQKARKCSELFSNILRICSVKPSSKGHSRGWAQLKFFFGHQTEHIFYSGAVLLGFLNVSISCH